MTPALSSIEQEIAHYKPPDIVVEAMRELDKMGFRFSGHGTDFNDEDWSLDIGEDDLRISVWLYRKGGGSIYIDLDEICFNEHVKNTSQLIPIVKKLTKLVAK